MACVAFGQIQYKGIGILKLKKDDHVLILPDSAYIITPEMYEWGLNAHSKLGKNTSDKIIERQKQEIERLKDARNEQSNAYTDCLLDQKDIIKDYQTQIDNVKSELQKAEVDLEELKVINEQQQTLIAKQRKRSKIRTLIASIPIVAILAYIGIDALVS